MKNNSAKFIQTAEWRWWCFSVRLWFGVQTGHLDPENTYFKLTRSISSWTVCCRQFPDAEASRLLPSRLTTFHSTVNISRTYITNKQPGTSTTSTAHTSPPTNNQAHEQQHIHHHQPGTSTTSTAHTSPPTRHIYNINSTYITTNNQAHEQQYIHHYQPGTSTTSTAHTSPPTRHIYNINSTYITTNKQPGNEQQYIHHNQQPGTWTVHSPPPPNHHVQHQQYIIQTVDTVGGDVCV